MRKPNYSMERQDRERAKQAKATAKAEKRAGNGDENRTPDVVPMGHPVDPDSTEEKKSDH